MNLKKITCIAVGCVMALSLVACGKEEVQEKPEASSVQMTISIINDRDVDITGLSIYSDSRVDADEQTNAPENTGVSSLLNEGDVLTPGDTAKVTLTVDDPMFNATQDENGNTVGEQKFVISVTDVNGNTESYNDISLSDGATFTISDNGIYNGTPEDNAAASESTASDTTSSDAADDTGDVTDSDASGNEVADDDVVTEDAVTSDAADSEVTAEAEAAE